MTRALLLVVATLVTVLAMGPVPSPAGGAGGKRIVIDLSARTLTAYEGGAVVLDAHTLRLGTLPHPVEAGERRVRHKIRRLPCEVGSDAAIVVWILDLGDGTTIHGRHCKIRMGCHHEHDAVILRNDDAARLWEWASVGVPVLVRE